MEYQGISHEEVRASVAKRSASCVGAVVLALLVMGLTVGCSTKNYVRSQTGPLIQQTNELDTKTAADHRAILNTDERAQQGIAGANAAAANADKDAMAASGRANQASHNATEAVNRVDSLSGVVANLDNYKPLSDVSVTFAFDKSALTASDRKSLDQFAQQIQSARGYLLEVTGGTDSVGDANYNYALSQRRADAVVAYLAGKYNVPLHTIYMVGIGKDEEVATNRTSAGRAKNRRVEIRLLSNRSGDTASASAAPASAQSAQ
jgi:OOP family OmpA-OmpF porin